MNKLKQNIIIKVEAGSIAEELGIQAGDTLLSINGKQIVDVFDYRYLINEEYIEVEIKKNDGEQWILEIDKDFDEDLGIVFESGLMDNAKSCSNKCIFCFIDQMPPNMRDTLYFKDDDSRLSFLQGNYVTLTNMKQKDIDRIIYYHLSPINISVHTTNLELRKDMLKNKFATNLFDYINQLAKARVEMNCQVVLCKNINDKEKLDKTIEDLSKYIPHIKSLSVVPVGLTKYRQNLYPLEPFNKEDALNVIEQINLWQNELKSKHNNRFVFAADEFYLTANIPVPSVEAYEDFPQIENGVGMMSLMKYELEQALSKVEGDNIKRKLSIATGEAAYDYICELSKMVECKFKSTNINVYKIKNNFFGGKVTVVGLLTGQDLLQQLKGKDLGDYLLLSKSILKAEDTVLLDDIDISEVETKLNTKIRIVENTGEQFLSNIVQL